jgi:hypothetical protein
MQTRKRILAIVVAVALSCILSGCDTEITGASPDPDVVITAKPGDKLTFSVTGPAEGSFVLLGGESGSRLARTSYEWKSSYVDNSYVDKIGDIILLEGGKTLTYTVPAAPPYNKIWICCTYHAEGRTFDYRTWTIRIQGTPPTWNDSYYLEDQTDLNILKDYTTVTGNLVVRGGATTSLIGLEKLKTIGRSLIINETSLKNLQGLENLTSVMGISIADNTALASLDALKNISRVSGGVFLGGMPLASLNGISNLSSIGGGFSIQYLNNLVSLDGLSNLISVGGSLELRSMDKLTSLAGLENLTSVGGIFFDWCYMLSSIKGLEGVTSVSGSIWILYCEALADLQGLKNLTRVGDQLWIFENTALCNSLAEALRNQVQDRNGIGGSIDIRDNMDCATP